jgi:Uma2 family endonuclease
MPVMPREHDWTVEDLDHLPDDGLQYELLDGLLLVSPAPVFKHQLVSGNLYALMRAACPRELVVLFSPVDWQPDPHTSLQPDLLVMPSELVEVEGARSVTQAVPLVVEILSPSTRRKDLVFKRSKYEDEGVGAYWEVDPSTPSIQAYELRAGHFADVGSASGPDALELRFPFPISITPSELVVR